MKPLSLEGHKYGTLHVVARHPENDAKGQTRWKCLCKLEYGGCGNTKVIIGADLRSGNTISCGCVGKENRRKSLFKHGLTDSHEHHIWVKMVQRCHNEKNPAYPDYGGRGITVCERWKENFAAFYEDMGPRPSLEHTVERKDSDGSYCKDNCHWATRLEQGNNTRRNVYYEFDGERKTLSAWCRELNINYKAMHHLLTTEMSFEDAADKLIKEGKTFSSK